jgi:hypothetical protein
MSARHTPAAGGSRRSVRIDPEERRRLIAEAAYFKAQRRGFASGGELADWLEAEAEIDALLSAPRRRSARAPRQR